MRTHALHVSVELMQSTSTEPRGKWHLSLPGVKKGTHDKRAAHSTHTHTHDNLQEAKWHALPNIRTPPSNVPR